MIGQRIKEIRNNNNLTQEELADGIISRTYLSLIEKGSVHPSTNVLIKLSERLDCSVNDFMQEVSHFRYNDVEILREIAYYEQKIEQEDYTSLHYFIEKEYEAVEQIPAPDSGRIHLLYAKYFKHSGDRRKLNFHVDRALELLSTVSINQSYIDAVILKVGLLADEDAYESSLDLLEDTLYTILRFSDLDLGVIRIMFEVAECYQKCGEYFTSSRFAARIKKQSKMLHIDYRRDALLLLEGKNLAMLKKFHALDVWTSESQDAMSRLLNCYAKYKNGNIKAAEEKYKDIDFDLEALGQDRVLYDIHKELEERLGFI
ncbi:helix-turn-helix transcriptional regulator [Salinicoccus sp. ID82-1]|uniref:helix-turn-helix domain-containing protein n=1 Tax=Salinicoccus sp. ID82-1 TaxID=2820269 RepID=UPI001F2C78B5|nr:helix-turn-helix transcriptional regulator [Salinicoccus sp. ID82-1]MCG1010300.1 helix-turn-helix transcriptional regulator [Salinicoccus sp. ID82-1]